MLLRPEKGYSLPEVAYHYLGPGGGEVIGIREEVDHYDGRKGSGYVCKFGSPAKVSSHFYSFTKINQNYNPQNGLYNIYVCIYVCVRACARIYMPVCVCMRVFLGVREMRTCVRVFVNVCVCMRTCAVACVCVFKIR